MPQNTPNLIAGGDVLPFRFVQLSGSNTGTVLADAAGPAAGVSEKFPKRHNEDEHAETGDPLSLQAGDVVQVECGEAIGAGDLVKAGTAGRAFEWDDDTTEWIHGQAMQAGAAAGAIIWIQRFNASPSSTA